MLTSLVTTTASLGIVLTQGTHQVAGTNLALSLSRSAITLTGHYDRAQLTALSGNRDVTRKVTWSSSNPRIISVDAKGRLSPIADGIAGIIAELGSSRARAVVTVKGTRNATAVSFENDIVPTLSRLGCSGGTCHGAAQGKGGFRLSLRGYAPDADYLSITHHMNGRRITHESPERSLFLRKPLLEVAHRGGRRMNRDSADHRLLLAWISQGAPGPSSDAPRMVGLMVRPGTQETTPGETRQVTVLARFTDGAVRDVTHRAIFAVNNPAIATVDEDGLVTHRRPGETAVTAKYMDRLAIAVFSAPFRKSLASSQFGARNNFVDDHIHAKLRRLGIDPSPLCTDEEFLRRVYIDTIGVLPTGMEAREFLKDRSPQRREVLVDSLLKRPEFGQVWALKVGDLMLLRREYMGRKSALSLQHWLMTEINSDRPWDELAKSILTATGDVEQNPSGLFYVSRAPQKNGERYWIRATENSSELIAQVFLGNRIQCARCHNHPTESTTQDDYYRFAALWHQVTGKDGDGAIPERIEATGSGELRHLRTNEVVQARTLDRRELTFAKGEDRRIQAANWLTHTEDFSRNIVNRLWARCFGAGIIEGVDDLRSTNPATNEPLMRALCEELKSHKFSLKHVMKVILTSATYQRSSKPTPGNRTDTRYFSHYLPRRLQAEEMADALCQATAVDDKYQNLPKGVHASELTDSEIPAVMLDTFGRPPRVTPSDSERSCSPAISQALALLNGTAIQEKLKSGECILNDWLTVKMSDEAMLDEIYLRTLSRFPTRAEQTTLLTQVRAAPEKERREAWQDVFWSVLNCKEFLFNH